MSCNHSHAPLYLSLVSYEFRRHNHQSPQDPHTQTTLSVNDTCSESSDRVTLAHIDPVLKHSVKPTTDREGEAFSRAKSQTPSQNQTNEKIYLRQARPNRISVDCVKHRHKGHKGVTWMSQIKLCFTFQTTVWSLKIWM